MAIYLKKFENHTHYETYTASTEFITPNVSLCEQENEVHYNPYVEPSETKLVCKYNVTSTSSPTALWTNYEPNVFKSMEIDGVMLDELVTAYTFNSVGEHIVKYELYDKTRLGGNSAPIFGYIGNLTEAIIPDSVTSIGDSAFFQCSGLTSIVIPSGVTTIGNSAFGHCRSLVSITSNAVTAPTIGSTTFGDVKTGGTLYVPQGSSGYDTWMQNANYYLGIFGWTKVEQ